MFVIMVVIILVDDFQDHLSQLLSFPSSICLGGEVSLSSKDILEIVERKKQLGQKVVYPTIILAGVQCILTHHQALCRLWMHF